MKVAAIIGADSMLGRELAVQLQEHGIVVIGVGRAMHHDIVLDLAEPLNRNICAGRTTDVVFHCASAFTGDDFESARTNFLTNAVGCLNVLELMEQLQCNSCLYAGTLSSIEGFESSLISSYGLSKAQGEKILEWGIARRGGVFCSLRLSQLYDTDGLCCVHQPWFGRIIAYASRGLDLRLPPSAGVRNFLHVADAARLMICAAKMKLKGNWPLCHPESLDNTKIAEIAFREFGCGGNIVIDHNKKAFRPVCYPKDFTVFNQLQDKPRISMAEGMSMIHHSGSADRFGPMDVL